MHTPSAFLAALLPLVYAATLPVPHTPYTCIMDPGHNPLIKDINKIMDISLCEKDPPFLSAAGSVCRTVWASNWALIRVCPPPIKDQMFSNGVQYKCDEIAMAVNQLLGDCSKDSREGPVTGGRVDLSPSHRGYVVVRKPEPKS